MILLRFFRLGDARFWLFVKSVRRYNNRNDNHSFVKHASERTSRSIVYDPHNAGGNGEKSEVFGIFYTERYGCTELSCNGKQGKPAIPCDNTYNDHKDYKKSRNYILCVFLFSFFCKNQVSYASCKIRRRADVSAQKNVLNAKAYIGKCFEQNDVLMLVTLKCNNTYKKSNISQHGCYKVHLFAPWF